MYRSDHRLRVDPADAHPASMFDFQRPSLAVVLGGFGALLAQVVALLLVVGIGVALHRATEALAEATRNQPTLEEDDVIEARFVVLGRELEPNEMPNRIVPRLNTAPSDDVVPTRDTPLEQADPREHPDERDPQALLDEVLRRSQDLPDPFAEEVEEREREGNPDGIAEGTQTEATPGDLYRGRLYSFFRRGWTIPRTLEPEEIQALVCAVNVQIGQNLEIVSFEMRTPSANPLFDQSVIEQLTRLQAAGATIPPPPEEVANEYIGREIALRFHGRDAR